MPGNYQPEALKELSEHYDLLLHDADVSVPEQVSSLLVKAQSLSDITLIHEQQVEQPFLFSFVLKVESAYNNLVGDQIPTNRIRKDRTIINKRETISSKSTLIIFINLHLNL